MDSIKSQNQQFNEYLSLYIYVCTDYSKGSTNINFLLKPQKMESTKLNDYIVILEIDFSYKFYCQLRSSNNAIQGYYIFDLNIHK